MSTRLQYSSFGSFEEGQVANGPCWIYAIQGHAAALSATNVYVQLFDRTNAPSAGDVPTTILEVFANDHFWRDWPEIGFRFETGLYVALSSTRLTYTALGASDVQLEIIGVQE